MSSKIRRSFYRLTSQALLISLLAATLAGLMPLAA
jgi:hypothetical protein